MVAAADFVRLQRESTVIIKNRSAVECETPRELLKELPNLELVKNEMYDKIDMDSCLCQVDLDYTFDKAGIAWECDCMEFRINAI